MPYDLGRLRPTTLKVITELRSITAAMKYAKVNFYTMKTLLETNEPHNGKIFKDSLGPPRFAGPRLGPEGLVKFLKLKNKQHFLGQL
jgi:hypothetical protein